MRLLHFTTNRLIYKRMKHRTDLWVHDMNIANTNFPDVTFIYPKHPIEPTFSTK